MKTKPIVLGIVAVVLLGLPGLVWWIVNRPRAFVLDRELAVSSDFRQAQIAFLPGGERLLLGGEHASSILLFETSSFSAGRPISKGPMFYGMSVSSDGKLVATMTPGPVLAVLDIASGARKQTFPQLGILNKESIAWSPDGLWLACSDSQNLIHIGDLKTGSVVQTLTAPGRPNGFCECLTISPDGTMLVSGGTDGIASIWSTPPWKLLRTLDAVGQETRDLEMLQSVAFSRDGSLLAAGGGFGWTRTDGSKSVSHGTIRVWKVSDWSLYRTLDLPGIPESLSFSPDDNLLAFGGWGLVSVWDLGANREIWSKSCRTGGMPSICFSDQGDLAYVDPKGPINLWKRVREGNPK